MKTTVALTVFGNVRLGYVVIETGKFTSASAFVRFTASSVALFPRLAASHATTKA